LDGLQHNCVDSNRYRRRGLPYQKMGFTKGCFKIKKSTAVDNRHYRQPKLNARPRVWITSICPTLTD